MLQNSENMLSKCIIFTILPIWFSLAKFTSQKYNNLKSLCSAYVIETILNLYYFLQIVKSFDIEVNIEESSDITTLDVADLKLDNEIDSGNSSKSEKSNFF